MATPKNEKEVATAAKIHMCTYCGKTYMSRGGMNKHVRVHENRAPYRCCGKLFFDRGSLDTHRCNVHDKDKTETCELCGKAFASLQLVRQHRRLVHDDETYRCDLCAEVFKTKIMLHDHKSKHTGRKNYSCTCGRAYQYASGYHRHRRSCDKSNV